MNVMRKLVFLNTTSIATKNNIVIYGNLSKDKVFHTFVMVDKEKPMSCVVMPLKIWSLCSPSF